MLVADLLANCAQVLGLSELVFRVLNRFQKMHELSQCYKRLSCKKYYTGVQLPENKETSTVVLPQMMDFAIFWIFLHSTGVTNTSATAEVLGLDSQKFISIFLSFS